MNELPQWLWPVLTALASFAGSYGGVRARLIAAEKSAEHAHHRIDNHLAQHIEGKA